MIEGLNFIAAGGLLACAGLCAALWQSPKAALDLAQILRARSEALRASRSVYLETYFKFRHATVWRKDALAPDAQHQER